MNRFRWSLTVTPIQDMSPTFSKEKCKHVLRVSVTFAPERFNFCANPLTNRDRYNAFQHPCLAELPELVYFSREGFAIEAERDIPYFQ